MTRPLPATNDLPSTKIKLHKHWNLRPGLALQIEDALKEKFLEIPHPIFDSLARLMMYEVDLYSCYKQANAFDPLRTQVLLREWFPQEVDWDQFFITMDLLKSTRHYFSKQDTPISFIGFTLEDAKALLQLGFSPPSASYLYSTSTWDPPKKQLALHLVTKMDQMRKAQGYTSLIFHAHSQDFPGPSENKFFSQTQPNDNTSMIWPGH
ncbi:hypothetical protein PGTUg99_031115 [Puccinia graminis f. sp. tritici]|uniref:Uncharacterized protein n=1 Tax=Puccinia graminis f. sp. tritici TaxID=56615 RepID=A0A5B0N1J5_PUCGR|nr:hypothetical protein PGTUg99_031115 [Puccinia graminis f. sp. tritici]